MTFLNGFFFQSFVTEIQGIKLARPLMELTQDDLRDYMECMDSDPKSSSSTTYSQSETSMPLPIDKVILPMIYVLKFKDLPCVVC